jgi:hypothetical protein
VRFCWAFPAVTANRIFYLSIMLIANLKSQFQAVLANFCHDLMLNVLLAVEWVASGSDQTCRTKMWLQICKCVLDCDETRVKLFCRHCIPEAYKIVSIEGNHITSRRSISDSSSIDSNDI